MIEVQEIVNPHAAFPEETLECVKVMESVKRFHPLHGYPNVSRDIYRPMASELSIARKLLPRNTDWNWDSLDQSGLRMHIAALMTAHKLTQYQFPLYFLSRNLMAAIRHTDMEDRVLFQELKMPLPTMAFVFPDGSLPSSDGKYSVSSLVLSVIYGSDYVRDPTVEVDFHARCTFLLYLIVKDRTGASLTSYTWFHTSDTAVRPDNKMQEMIDDHKATTGKDVAEHHVMFLEATRMAVGAILAMTYKPELLAPEVIHHWQHKDVTKRGNVAFWSPNIIGRDYQILGSKGDGSHASPRMHWRRGHFRNQACGTGRKEHKRIWLEPMLVAAMTDHSKSGPAPKPENV